MLGITADGTATLLRGIAALLWPTVALVAVVLLREELRDLVRRIRSGRILGQEFELAESLDTLAREADQLLKEPLPPVTSADPKTAPAVTTSDPPPSADRMIEQVLALAGTSPRAALMLLAAELERRGRQLLAVTGHLSEVGRGASLRAIAEALERATAMPRGALDAFSSFSRIRNEIVHGGQNVPDEEILRAVDSGVVLLRALWAVPHERHVVHHPGVAIYGDPGGEQRLDGLGVILSTTSAGGAVTRRQVFPTSLRHFQPGMEVTWEWNLERVWPEAWYRDPDTTEITHAWSGSVEFVGTALDDV